MKKKYFWGLSTLALALVGHVGAQQAYQWGTFSPNDALTAVQIFEKSPNPITAIPKVQHSPLWEPSDFDLTTEYQIQDGYFTYYVSAYTPTRFARINNLFVTNSPRFMLRVITEHIVRHWLTMRLS